MNNNILDFIFDARSEELAKLTEEDKEFLNSPKYNIDNDYEKFINSLNELPEEIKKSIKEKFDKCIDTNNFMHYYFYSKYYKLGFCECMKLILDCNSL